MQLATPEQKTAIVGVLGQVHISDATEEDLKAGKEEIKVNQSINHIINFITVHVYLHVAMIWEEGEREGKFL